MLEVAIGLVRQAGALLREGHRSGAGQTDNKSSSVDLVTAYDLASEQLISAGLRAQFPDHAIHGEENGGELPAHGPIWVIDPLDGTTNFAHGFPVFSVTVALLLDRTPVLGVIYDPLRDELLWAEQGRGAWCDGRRMQVAEADTLSQCLLATGFPYDRAATADNNLAEFSYFMPKTRGVRRAGSAALDIGWVAAGRLNGYWERGVQVWDVAAGVLMVREAGGVVTTYQGDPWQPGDRFIVAASRSLHPILLQGITAARAAVIKQG
ncbi:MAG: inositol monophosphatase family protein [Caldilineales bacterium]